ncbi:MAG: hypothetical protein O3C40_10920 [Planctomycetota bacterium]|nr:hypothetical protein [Planctomycetota bacterium]
MPDNTFVRRIVTHTDRVIQQAVSKLGLRSIPVHDNFPTLSVGSVIALDGGSSCLTSIQRAAGIAVGRVLIGSLAPVAA